MFVSIKAYSVTVLGKWTDDVFCDSGPGEMLGCETPGWNEVIWPSACFHLRPEETVNPALPFSHTIISPVLSFPPVPLSHAHARSTLTFRPSREERR